MSDSITTLRERIAADIVSLTQLTQGEMIPLEIPGHPDVLVMIGVYPRELVEMMMALVGQMEKQHHGRAN